MATSIVGIESLDADCREDLEAAKTISQIRLLVVGMGGLGAVVVRDAIKAGFRSVTMMDHKDWSEEDRPSQFLIAPESEVPENRAEASIERAQTLNHQVEVQVETRDVKDVDDHYFINRWDVVVAADLDVDAIVKLNCICRKFKMKFFAANVFGLFGYFFSDLLNKHAFRKSVRGIYTSYGNKDGNKVLRWEQFVPFDTVINYKFDKIYDVFHASPWYYVMRGLLKFLSENGRRPTKEGNDFETVNNLINDEIEACFSRDESKVPHFYIQMCLGPEIPVICQLVGSMLSKEVVKSVTRNEEPYNNLYFFNPVRSKGEIYNVS